MARKYSAKKRNKIEPAVQTLTFSMGNPYSPGAGQFKYFVDLSQVASLVNRRFYRQGINWAVAGFKVVSSEAFSMNVSKLPNTWVMSNAWEKGMRSWQRMNKEALMETESVRPRFLDFKVYANKHHAVNGVAGNQLPLSSENNLATPGEWEMSKYVIPRTDSTTGVPSDREIIATGASYPGAGASGFNSVSLIEGYASSRGLPNVRDPNVPDDAADASGVAPQNWMAALFNQGTEQDESILEDMIAENNIAPYPFENDGANPDTMYPGGANQLIGLQIHDIATVTPTTVGGITRLKGGNFPCGLIEFNISSASAPSMLVQIDLVPGNHRGYLCEPMTEM
jgi:hypothetical protein